MGRDEMIQSLVLERYHEIIERRRSKWLLQVLEHGFAGYSHLGEDELSREAKRFGILCARPADAANDNFDPDADDAHGNRLESDLVHFPRKRARYEDGYYEHD